MQEPNTKISNDGDSYKRYLEDIEKRKVARLNLIENISEEELQQFVIAYYQDFDIKKTIMDFCLHLNLKYDFDTVRHFLDGLPNITERLKVLYTLKYDFERESEMTKCFPYVTDYLSSRVLDFNKFCQSEIDKYNILLELEATAKQPIVDKLTLPREREGMNKERAFLFFEYLLTFVSATQNKTKRHQLIELLTGYKIKQLSKIPSWFEKEKLEIEEKTESSEKFFKDMEAVRKLFLSLGLTEIADKIYRDLGN